MYVGPPQGHSRGGGAEGTKGESTLQGKEEGVTGVRVASDTLLCLPLRDLSFNPRDSHTEGTVTE